MVFHRINVSGNFSVEKNLDCKSKIKLVQFQEPEQL